MLTCQASQIVRESRVTFRLHRPTASPASTRSLKCIRIRQMMMRNAGHDVNGITSAVAAVPSDLVRRHQTPSLSSDSDAERAILIRDVDRRTD
jgi:hypothetical protein